MAGILGSLLALPDGLKPAVKMIEPADGTTLAFTVTLTALARDNVGVVGVQFKVDGTNIGAEDTTDPYTISWDSTTVADGPHTLTAVARDAAGNSTTSAPINITVSNANPPPVNYYINVSGYIADYNLYNDLISKGWNGISPVNAVVTIAGDGVLYASSTGAYAFNTGTGYPAGSTLKLTNNGIILGHGGAGGAGGLAEYVTTISGFGGPVQYWNMYGATAGSAGGPALIAQHSITITNNNLIAGGGGGGGGGGAGKYHFSAPARSGGGGGGGLGSGAGGQSPGVSTSYWGNSGSFVAPGTGGAGVDTAGSGGAGGSYGQAGAAGTNGGPVIDAENPVYYGGFYGAAGGAAGAAIVGNGNIAWVATGNIQGAIT